MATFKPERNKEARAYFVAVYLKQKLHKVGKTEQSRDHHILVLITDGLDQVTQPL